MESNPKLLKNDLDSDEPDSAMVDGRCRVIKILQEQVSNQNNENGDYNKLKAQLVLVEQTLQMKEAEYKLQIDDLEYEIERLRKENEKLKETNFKQKMINSVQLNIEGQPEDEITKKYKKWKTKYHSLEKSDPSYQGQAKVFHLESELKQKDIDNQKKYDEITKLTQKNIELNNKLMKLKEELTKTRSEIEGLNSKNTKFQNVINNLNTEKKKIKEEAKQKATLLQHNRRMHSREEKQLKEKEQNVSQQLKSQRIVVLNQQNEINKLNATVEKEIKERKSIIKKFNKLKQANEEVIKKLNEQIETLKNENDDLKRDLEESRTSSNSLEDEVNALKSENGEMFNKLKRAAKLKEHNIQLAQTITEMQNTIENLHTSLSSIESDSSAKTEQVRSMLSKNYAGIDPSMEWGDILAYIDNVIVQSKIAQEENDTLTKQLKKTTKNFETLKEKSEDSINQLTSRNEFLTRKLQEVKEQIKDLTEGQTNHRSIFCLSVRKKLYREFSLYYNTTQELLARFNNVPYQQATMRNLILVSIFAVRFRHYKHDQPFDGSTILVFSGSKERNYQSPILDLRDKIDGLFNKIHEDAEIHDKLNEVNTEIQNNAKQYLAKIRELQQKYDDQIKINEDLKAKIYELNKALESSKSSSDYENLEAMLKKRNEDYSNIERQFIEMKVEMKRLLSTIDVQQNEDHTLQANIEELTLEIEQVKQINSKLRQELEIAQAALRDKNREILALERRLIKQKSQVVVVKDQIPTGMVPPPQPQGDAIESTKSNFYMTDSLRNSLALMQNRLMRKNEII